MSKPTFQTLRLSRGKHSSPQHGACAVELASMLAGERFSDRPSSVSPAIASFMRGYNDLLEDDRRQDLLPYAASVVGTAGSDALERARMRRLVEWADERWQRGPVPSVIGRMEQLWAWRVPPTDPDTAGMYAVRSIRHGGPHAHREALALVQELIEMGRNRPFVHAVADQPAEQPARTGFAGALS
jgi:hypothetical protein